MKSKYLECGKIINTHGIGGEVKAESYCDTPQLLSELKEVFCKDGENMVGLTVFRAYVHKGFVIMKFKEISDIDAAMSLKGSIIYADRESFVLKEGSFFIADLIGLNVIDNTSGEIYGKVTDVINRGASDIYVVETPDGEKMIPAVEEFIKKTDIDKGIFVQPIEGLL